MTATPPARRVTVRVPASSANLGPGFDVLAAALALHLEVEVTETGSFAVHTDLDVARGRGNLLVRSFERLCPADRFEFRIRSAIPLSGGLGSSAAAILAGLLAGAALAAQETDVRPIATELEGHPDNVGAALHGGFVVCNGDQVQRIAPPIDLEAVLVIPHEPVRTADARAALPAVVPLGDATANLAALATLILGLERADTDLIARGLRDRLHQPYRSHLYPRSAALLERAPALGALGATISGAGPSVLVWVMRDGAARVSERLRAEVGDWAEVVPASFEPHGARRA